MKIIVVFIVCLFSFLAHQKPVKVDKVVIYKNFPPGGTPSGILGAFHRPSSNRLVDTTIIETIDTNKWNAILNRSKRKNYYPISKIAGINYAGYMMIDGDEHFYIEVSDAVIVDVTDNYYYRVKEEDRAFITRKN